MYVVVKKNSKRKKEAHTKIKEIFSKSFRREKPSNFRRFTLIIFLVFSVVVFGD